MKKLTKTKKLLLIATGLVVALSLGYTFLFNAMKQRTESAAGLLTQVEELSATESKFSESVATLKKEALRIAKLETYFIRESEVVAFTQKIEALGVESGTVLSLESLDPGVNSQKVPVLNFQVKAKGTFDGVMRALALLENLPAKLQWKNVRINSAETSVGKNITTEWTLNASLTALNFIHE